MSAGYITKRRGLLGLVALTKMQPSIPTSVKAFSNDQLVAKKDRWSFKVSKVLVTNICNFTLNEIKLNLHLEFILKKFNHNFVTLLAMSKMFTFQVSSNCAGFKQISNIRTRTLWLLIDIFRTGIICSSYLFFHFYSTVSPFRLF